MSAKASPGRFVLIVGRRCTGKTTCAKRLVANVLAEVVVHTHHPLEWKHSSRQITSDYSEFKELLEQRINLASSLGHVPDRRLVVVVDEGHINRRDLTFTKFLMNARHFGAAVIFVTQCISGLSPENRCQFDSVIQFHQPFQNQLKLVYNGFITGVFPLSFREFCYVAKMYTKDYGAIWIDNVESAVYEWKASFQDEKQRVAILRQLVADEDPDEPEEGPTQEDDGGLCRIFAKLEVKHDEEAKDKDTACVACTENRAIVAFAPCGHVPVCIACAKQLSNVKCPLCRVECTSALVLRGL